jgi:hypothetical protein
MLTLWFVNDRIEGRLAWNLGRQLGGDLSIFWSVTGAVPIIGWDLSRLEVRIWSFTERVLVIARMLRC